MKLTMLAILTVALPISAAAASPPNQQQSKELREAFAAAYRGEATIQTTDGGSRSTLDLTPKRLVKVGDVQVLISEAQNESSAHVNTGSLALAYLRKATWGYELLGTWPTTVQGSAFGRPPKWQVRSDLFSNPTIEATFSWSGMGCHVASDQLVELTASGPVVRASGLVTNYSYEPLSASAPGSKQAVSGRVAPGRRNEDFFVYYRGSFNTTVHYLRKGDHFEPAHVADLPGC